MGQEIEHLTEDSFASSIASGVILVDCYADWCGPCRMLTPVLEKVAKDLAGKARIAKLDIDQAQNIASSFQVASIPTLLLFKNGKHVGSLVGLQDGDTIKHFVATKGLST